MYNFFKSIIEKRMEEGSNCPAYYCERLLEDYDEGCRLGDMKCGDYKHCYYPKLLIKRKIKKHFEKEEKYWEKEAEKIKNEGR